MTSGLFAAVDQGAQRAYEVPVLTEHDRPGLRARHRLGLGQELVAGGNEGGDLGAGVAVAGTGYIGVDGAHLAGERGSDRVGAGVGWHPEPSGGIHDPMIMARPGRRAAVEEGRTGVCGPSPRADDASAWPGPERSLNFFFGRCATFGPTSASKTVAVE